MQEETYEQRRKRLVVLLICFTWHLWLCIMLLFASSEKQTNKQTQKHAAILCLDTVMALPLFWVRAPALVP